MFCQPSSSSISRATFSRRLARIHILTLFTLGILAFPNYVFGQTQPANAASVPRLIRYAGVTRDLNGTPLSGAVGVTFSLYAEQTGGAALWMETQNVQADAGGHYSILLGSTKPDGLPSELFASEQARWIGVQIEQQAEQSRALLVSAPYALKAGDAETLGGLPPSAFLRATLDETQDSGPDTSKPGSGKGRGGGGRKQSPSTALVSSHDLRGHREHDSDVHNRHEHPELNSHANGNGSTERGGHCRCGQRSHHLVKEQCRHPKRTDR